LRRAAVATELRGEGGSVSSSGETGDSSAAGTIMLTPPLDKDNTITFLIVGLALRRNLNYKNY